MDEVLFQILSGLNGDIGKILLNRPKQLNALNLSMCMAMKRQLLRWQSDQSIKAVIIASTCDKAFCAGGDIRAVYEFLTQGNFDEPLLFFRAEYELNKIIYDYPKPFIAFLDGLTLGGGAGISMHGSHPIATERLIWGMPETKIGFYPDVGVGYHLARMPNAAGYYLALTGATIDAETAYQYGIVKHQIPHDKLKALEEKLISTEFSANNFSAIDMVIEEFSLKQRKSKSTANYACFSNDSVMEILNSLRESPEAESKKVLEDLLKNSPTSLLVTFQHLSRAKHLNFHQVMVENLRLSTHFIHNHDLKEGIRAILIDKDQQPCWKPSSMLNINNTNAILEYFS